MGARAEEGAAGIAHESARLLHPGHEGAVRRARWRASIPSSGEVTRTMLYAQSIAAAAVANYSPHTTEGDAR
jgi:hypothetical protein